MSTQTKKTPAKKSTKPASKSAKQKLAEGAAAIQKLRQGAKSPAAKKTPATGNSGAKNGTSALAAIEAIKPSATPVDELMRDRALIAPDWSRIEILDGTPIEEFVPIFDRVSSVGQRYQFVMGDLYNEGFRLYGPTFAQRMAASGRPVSTLKKWASVTKNIPEKLRSPHPKLDYSHMEPVARLADKPKEQKEFVAEIVSEAKAGKVPTSRQIVERVDKLAPKKKRANTPAKKAAKTATPKRDMTTEERDTVIDLEEKAAALEGAIGGASFVTELKGDDTMVLREKLGAIARFHALISGS